MPGRRADHIVAVCASPGPHGLQRLDLLARREEAKVTYLAMGGSSTLREWRPEVEGFAFRFMQLYQEPYECVPRSSLGPRLREALQQLAPTVVLAFGYDDPIMRSAARWARVHGALSLTFFDSTRLDRPRVWWKEAIKRQLVRRLYDGAFVAGTRSAAYATELGIPPDHVITGYGVVDNDHFRRLADAARDIADELRRKRGLPDRHFLYVGRLAPEKNLPLLLRAYARYRGERPDGWGLVLVGGGPQEAELRAVATGLRAPDVIFVPFQTQEALPALYGLAACLVLPSLSEPWGMVVNEAMAAGLPVLVSERCGCVPELVREGVNGFIYDPAAESQMVELLARVSSDECDLGAMARASQEIIAGYTLETWVDRLLKLIVRVRASQR